MGDEFEGAEAIYIPKRAGRITDGAEVYAENGCYQCHTQLVRPTYAGNDMFRPDWGGLADDEDRGDTRRETNAFDFTGEEYAMIGISRIGQDLSNLGVRVEKKYAPEDGISAEEWLYRHLYNPQWKPLRRESACAPMRFLFEERRSLGNAFEDGVPFVNEDGVEMVPKSEARALVSYLLSLKKDQSVPSSINFAPPSPEPASAPANPAVVVAEDETLPAPAPVP